MLEKLKQAFRIIMSYSENKINVRNIKYLPRWVVLIIDTLLICISLIVSIIILNRIRISPLDVLEYSIQASIVISVNVIFFFLYKTYSGLIRHSSMMDALKLFLASMSTTVVCLMLNVFYQGTYGDKIFITTGLIMYSFISFSILFLFRIAIKQLYEFFKIAQREEDLIDVAILGIDENAISIAAALEMEHPKRFLVKGFVSRNNFKRQLRILEKPVVRVKESILPSLRILNVKAIIITSAIDPKEKQQIVDECLENEIKMYSSPILSNFEEGNSPQIQKLQIEDLLEREPIVLNKKNKEHQLKNRTVLVTGGAGSIGSEIVRQVAEYKPKMLLVLDQAESPLHQIQLEINEHFPNLKYKCIICDVTNNVRLQSVFDEFDIDVIYHAAAYKHVPLMENNPHEAILTNILGTKQVADLAAKFKVGHFVMVSTDKAVNPSNVMGASKRASEMYVQSLNYNLQLKDRCATKFITTRFGNVLGSNGSVVPLFKKQIEEGGPVTITHPDIIRYFMTIPEACQLVLEAGAMGKGGEIFIFDMGKPVKIMDLAKKMIKLAGFIPNKDIHIKITGLRPGEKLYEELLSDEAKTLPTHHEKIMITKDRNDNYEFISSSIDSVINSANNHNNVRVVHKLKKMIPEFKSKNSSYESLDAEVSFNEIINEDAVKIKKL